MMILGNLDFFFFENPISERRVPPQFSIPPPAVTEVMFGATLNLTCVAYGAPMPYVKWRKEPDTDMTPDDKLPVGRNVLILNNIQQSANYTCVAASDLGLIDATTMVKVQCKFKKKYYIFYYFITFLILFFSFFSFLFYFIKFLIFYLIHLIRINNS